MRGVHSAVDDIRRSVFTEVARLAYSGDDYTGVDMIPYKIVPGEVAHHRHDVFLERAVVSSRVRLALGMDLNPGGPSEPLSASIREALLLSRVMEGAIKPMIMRGTQKEMRDPSRFFTVRMT